MSKLRSQKSIIFGILAFVFVGCAAQDSERLRRTAEDKMRMAMQIAPHAEPTKEANDRFAAGQYYLSEGRYDQATRSFNQSIEASERVLSAKWAAPAPVSTPAPASAEPATIPEAPAQPPAPAPTAVPPAAATTPPVAAPSTEASTTVQAHASAPQVVAPSAPAPKPPVVVPISPAEKKNMPAKAYAKYLAAKKGEGAVENKAAPKASAQVIEKEVERKEEASAKKPSEHESTVVAPAAPALKKVPEVKAENSEAKEEKKPEPKKFDIEKSVPEKTEKGELAKRRIPGSLPFSINDPSVQAEALVNLDQTSKFLLDNPSTTLILQGHLGQGESGTLVDARFESIRSYLTGKGVPEDQIRLDNDRKVGKAEFQMFLIEH
ncbi:MAG: hypothetical protein J0L93_00955 [Deltaproteobacteria bacterium]|nr:hypothetical protein [Deltaproteobacteria bacterium]